MMILKSIGIGFLVILGIVALYIAYNLLRYVRDDLLEFVDKLVHKILSFIERKQQIKLNSVRILPADERGRQGISFDGTTYRNMDSGEVFTQLQIEYLDPIRSQLDMMQKTMLSLRGVSSPSQMLPAITDSQANALPQLPSRVNLWDVIDPNRVSLDNLTIGVAIDESGQVAPIQQSIHDLMHLLAIGITGAGKSTWVLAFLAMIEMCKEQIDVMCIDVHGSAFNVLADWTKLRYPIARDNSQAKAILGEVQKESKRRMKLYEAVPLAEDMPSYNSNTQGDQLYPWLVMIDEGTLMLADKSIKDYVASCVQGTRQYGIYVFMTGQTAKANVVDTPIRDNFPTRIAFNNEDTSLRVTLGKLPDESLEEIPGRGWARLKGKKTPIKLQAPMIKRGELYELIGHNGPMMPMPVIEGDFMSLDDKVRQAIDEIGGAGNLSAICRRVGMNTGGQDFYDVKDAVSRVI